MRYRAILKQITEDGRVDKEAIALHQKTSVAMVEVLLEELQRRGYLERDSFAAASGMCISCGDREQPGDGDSRSGACAGCAFAAKGLPESFWTITRKGDELLDSSPGPTTQ